MLLWSAESSSGTRRCWFVRRERSRTVVPSCGVVRLSFIFERSNGRRPKYGPACVLGLLTADIMPFPRALEVK